MILDIADNPFYILGAKISDTKEKIIELANEKYATCDIHVIDEAKENLLDLNKRLYYEMRWFPANGGGIKIILEYINNIRNGKKYYRVDIKKNIDITNSPDMLFTETPYTDTYIGILTEFNIEFYTFLYIDNTDIDLLRESILSFVLFYDKLINFSNRVIDDINNERRLSKMTEIEDDEKWKSALNLVENDIKIIISNKLKTLEEKNLYDIISSMLIRWRESKYLKESSILAFIYSEYYYFIEKFKYYEIFIDKINVCINPFFILGVEITDNKEKIISLFEEKLLFQDSKKVIAAEEKLLKLQKRTIAEVMWFSSCSSEQLKIILKYLDDLQNGIEKEPLNIDGNHYEIHMDDGDKWFTEGGIGPISDVDKFNIKYYSLPYLLCKKHDNIGDPLSLIRQIDYYFSTLDKLKIMDEINKKRVMSGFPLIQDVEIFDRIFLIYRKKIKKCFSIFLSLNAVYSNSVIAKGLIEEEFIRSNRNCAIIEDFISEYEIATSSYLDNYKNKLIRRIKGVINTKENGSILEDSINKILYEIKGWDNIARPLQLYARSRGKFHTNSQLIAKNARELALYSHNEAKNTDLAIKITNSLKKYFAELPEFLQIIKEDENTLNKINNEKVEHENLIRWQKEKNEKEEEKNIVIQLLLKFGWLAILGIIWLCMSQC
jgi:hypothetical protein